MRHGLLTKYVDACRASVALAGDYSPRTGRILPKPGGLGKPGTETFVREGGEGA